MAFPATGLLDNFNRANNTLLTPGNWSRPIIPGDGNVDITSNTVNGGGGWCGGYWSASQFGPDAEVYVTAPAGTGSGNLELLARLTSPNSGALNGYLLDVNTVGVWGIYKIASNSQSQIGASVTQAISSGDKIGFELIGSTLTGYRFTGGSWSSVISRTDSTFIQSGYIGVGILGSSTLDDFSGGTVVSAAVIPETIMAPVIIY